MQRGSCHDILDRGMGRFVWSYGVVCFGGLFFVSNTLVRWLSNNPAQRYDAAIVASLIAISFVYSLSVGAVFGFAAWYTVRLVYKLLMYRSRAAECSPIPELRGELHAVRQRSAATGD